MARFKKGDSPWNKGRSFPSMIGNKHALGNVPWNKGGTHSEETRIKISLAHKGKRHSPNTEFKKGQHSREKNINWKGGVTPLNRAIRTSSEYKEWRKNVFERDDYRCFDCGERGLKINADHIFPFALYPRLRFDINNGRTLCEPCHRNTSTFGNTHNHPKRNIKYKVRQTGKSTSGTN